MDEDEVYSYASMVAIFRSTWWPSGVRTIDYNEVLPLSDDNAFVSLPFHDPLSCAA